MDIVEELRKDPDSGAKRLEAEYKAGLMTLASRFLDNPSDAEELVNRTFAEVVANIDSYLEQSAFFGWMCQILKNIHANDCRRKAQGDIVYPGVVPDIEDERAQDEIYDNLDHSLLRDAIETLPNEMKEVIVMHYLMEEPVARVAKFIGEPVSTVKWRLHVARKALAAKLGAKVEAVNKKPGGRAVLIALALCGLTTLGAGVATLAGTLPRSVRSGHFVEMPLPEGTGGTRPPFSGEAQDSARNTPPAHFVGTPLSEGGIANGKSAGTHLSEGGIPFDLPPSGRGVARSAGGSTAGSASTASDPPFNLSTFQPSDIAPSNFQLSNFQLSTTPGEQNMNITTTTRAAAMLAAATLTTGTTFVAATYSPAALAAIAYTYEDDGKTCVATVTGENGTITTSDEDVATFSNGFTNFVKRGNKGLYVWAGAANSYTGDIRLEAGDLVFWGNALGIGNTPGTITIDMGNLVLYGGTIAKDIECALDSGDRWDGRSIQVWEGRTADITGKITIGNRKLYIYAYKGSSGGASLGIRGGIEDLADTVGYTYMGAYGGSTITIAEKPLNLKHAVYFPKADWALAEVEGFIGHYVFAVAGNRMMSLGYDGSQETLIDRAEVKTTVDWAFDNSSMSVCLGHDSVWDLFGTSQRIGTMKWRHRTGDMSVITNSLATPATLHMGKFGSYWHGDSVAPRILFGGNLSVVFEGDFTTTVDYEMTASGDLTINGDGANRSSTLAFSTNGSWANATNVTVKGAGKITIENSGALGSDANVNLASSSSLEIASGVTVKVRTLTVGGEQRHAGNYTFGSGTLSVSHPTGFVLSIR